jgi:hypothetical protein
MDKKRLFLIIGFIAVVILLAWALVAIIFGSLVKQPGQPVNGNTNGNLPNINQGNIPVVNTPNSTGGLPLFGNTETIDEVAQGGPTVVTDYDQVKAEYAAPTPNGLTYYNPDTSSFQTVGADGKITTLGSEKFYNVSNVTWAANKTTAILEYPDGSNILYDFNRGKQVSLPKELEKFSLDAQGASYTAIWNGGKPDATWLMSGTSDGGDLKIVEPIGDQSLNVNVGISPDNQIVAMYRKATGTDGQEVLPIGRNQEQFQSFNVDGLKFKGDWSPGGSYLLYSTASASDGYQPRLWLTEGTTGNIGYSQTNLQLNTWADKCAFDAHETSIYCAVPIDLPQGAGLYPDLAKGTPDVFYRIDLVSGNKVPLALPVGSQDSYSAQSVSLSADQSVLYFIDSTTGTLHSIRLK